MCVVCLSTQTVTKDLIVTLKTEQVNMSVDEHLYKRYYEVLILFWCLTT